jgi:hypothetical protein
MPDNIYEAMMEDDIYGEKDLWGTNDNDLWVDCDHEPDYAALAAEAEWEKTFGAKWHFLCCDIRLWFKDLWQKLFPVKPSIDMDEDLPF